LVVEGGRLHGHDTDVVGFDRFLRLDAGFEPAERSALIFGAGGAARACALALARDGLGSLTVAVRELSRADELRGSLEGFETELSVVAFDGASEHRFDLVLNATPLGAHGEDLPALMLGPGTLVVDLLYTPILTPIQVAARAAGGRAFGGLGLLLNQAALSFELWTGQQPPLDVMSAAALSELA
jgi:shikimate dehydrogenase